MNIMMDVRKVKMMGCGLTGCFLVIHIAMLLLFLFNHVTPMVYFNLFSIVFYLCSFLMLKKGLLWIYAVTVYLEVVVHMTLAVIFVGADSGFQITIIGMNVLAFYAEYISDTLNTRRVSGIALSVIGMVCYIGVFVYSWFNPPAYALSGLICFWLQIAWGIIVFGVNIFFLKVFVTDRKSVV